MFNFEKLETWHEAIAFAGLVYLTPQLLKPSLTWSSSLSFGLGMISARLTAAGPVTLPDLVDLLALCSYPYPMLAQHSPIPCLWAIICLGRIVSTLII